MIEINKEISERHIFNFKKTNISNNCDTVKKICVRVRKHAKRERGVKGGVHARGCVGDIREMKQIPLRFCLFVFLNVRAEQRRR